MAEASRSQPLLATAGESSRSDESKELKKPLLVTEILKEDGSKSRVGSALYTSLRAVIPAGEVSTAAVGEDAK